MDAVQNQLANLSLVDLGLDGLYSDEVKEISPKEMIVKIRELIHYCLENRAAQLPSITKESGGVVFLSETKRFVFVKTIRCTITLQSVDRLMILLIILFETLSARLSGDHMLPRSIRDVYYQFNTENAQFGLTICMRKLVKRIDELTCYFSCTRSSLGVTAESGNSAFIGHVIVVRKSDTLEDREVREDASILDRNHLINLSNIVRVEPQPDVSPVFILVVEKMTVFRNLLSARFHRSYPCIILTGGGEPSIECRLFLRLLVDTLKVPALFLGDCNPYGYEIFRTYKYGSINFAHMSRSLVTPSLQFLGLTCDDITYNAMMPMTEGDLKKARNMLCEAWVDLEPQLKRSLSLNHKKGRKTDIESMIAMGFGYLARDYLPTKIEEVNSGKVIEVGPGAPSSEESNSNESEVGRDTD